MNPLPTELSSDIARRLHPLDTLRLRLVCKAWKEVVDGTGLWVKSTCDSQGSPIWYTVEEFVQYLRCQSEAYLRPHAERDQGLISYDRRSRRSHSLDDLVRLTYLVHNPGHPLSDPMLGTTLFCSICRRLAKRETRGRALSEIEGQAWLESLANRLDVPRLAITGVILHLQIPQELVRRIDVWLQERELRMMLIGSRAVSAHLQPFDGVSTPHDLGGPAVISPT